MKVVTRQKYLLAPVQDTALLKASAQSKAARGIACLLASAAIVFGGGARAQDGSHSYSMFGTVGLIDMPTAESAPDAEFATTLTDFAHSSRGTLTFQMTPRLSGSFRYSRISRTPDAFRLGEEYALYDRSFDLRFRVLDETSTLPAVAIGLQDFVGTGVYSGEYVVATKSFGEKLKGTVGLGWGRFGSANGVTNPLGAINSAFETRPQRDYGKGGEVESSQWFRGDMGVFAGLSYQATDKLSFKVEYSSDDYSYERNRTAPLFDRVSPVNWGVSYEVFDGISLQAYSMYGSEIGVAITSALNPRKPEVFGGTESAPVPVLARDQAPSLDLGWEADPEIRRDIRTQTSDMMANEKMVLEAMKITGDTATIFIRTSRYNTNAQTIGRVARIATGTLPASVSTIVVVPIGNGQPLSKVVLRRQDLEDFESAPDGAWETYIRAQIKDAYGETEGAEYPDDAYPRFSWGLQPYSKASYFDPDNPIRIGLGAAATAIFNIRPGTFITGRYNQRLAGNLGASGRSDPSELPRVRTDVYKYHETDGGIDNLTLGHYFRPGPDLYGRFTLGYFETMYAGVSGELLWKPVDSRLALGVELNEVVQRDFDKGFGLRDYRTTTGHVSAYYAFNGGYLGQIDAGRYLAEDWGATFSLYREFDNGWLIGAYATLTDVPFETFGEGSFDKGIVLNVPLDYFTGKPVGGSVGGTIQPILRDGGARVVVPGRLYDTVREAQNPVLRNTWGRFWR